jgi:GTP-binding protein YchF
LKSLWKSGKALKEVIVGFRCGIVGLPNVGKSTLFNALTETVAAQAANYPFCTIEPNVGRVAVPDPRLSQLALMAGSEKIIPTVLEVVDIAGLVRGASQGEGLGNQFLGHIREVDAIIHVLRAFEDTDITHVEGTIAPLRDRDIVETELMLSDLDSLERRIPAFEKKMRHGKTADSIQLLEMMAKALKCLQEGQPVREMTVTSEERLVLQTLNLLTMKPVLYVLNVEEAGIFSGNSLTAALIPALGGAPFVIVSAAIEAEVALLGNGEDQKAFLEDLGLSETGLSRIVHEGYRLLGLLTYFTVGPKEARAWTFTQGMTAPQAAGIIHTDFERGFICAETIAFAEYIACNGEAGAKAQGKVRLEGKTYKVQDGDVVHFRFNV